MFRGRLVCVTRRLFFDTEMATKRANTKRSVNTVALPPLVAERITCTLSKWTGEVGRCQWCDTSIDSPRRRTWCSDKCGRAWQREHIWRFARSTAKRRAKYRCTRPGCTAARRDCEVNHITPRNGDGYGPGSIITSCRMRAATAVSRSCVARITPRSPRHRPRRVPRHDGPRSWLAKLRSSRGVS